MNSIRAINDEPLYPCADCGKLRTRAEGGTVFTVCDKCWEKRYKTKQKDCMPDLELYKHPIHTTQKDVKEHDWMGMIELARHLGVDLYIAMEIARWAVNRPKPKAEQGERL